MLILKIPRKGTTKIGVIEYYFYSILFCFTDL